MLTGIDLIRYVQSLPKKFRVVTTYESGVVKTMDVATQGQADGHALMQRRKVGKDLIDRVTGEKVKVVSVTIEAI